MLPPMINKPEDTSDRELGTPAGAATTASSAGPRRRWVFGAIALVAGAAVVAAITLWPSVAAKPAPAASASAPGPADLLPAALPQPSSGASVIQRGFWVAQEAARLESIESEALVAGDFTRYASVADPADTTAMRDLHRRFDNLRALKVTRFDSRMEGLPKLVDAARKRWRVVNVSNLCLVESDCDPDVTMLDSLWTETPKGLRFAAFANHDYKSQCSRCNTPVAPFVRPWEVTDLAVRIGKRTVVAIPVQDRAKLPALAAKAESAAAHADKYTIGNGPVDRYHVFIADDQAWKRWYDGLPGRWVAGQALPTGRSEVEVEAKLSELTPGYADTLLRHELAHVATLRSDRYYGRDDVWWLVEGMAEYAATEGPYPDHADLRTYLRGHTLRSVVVTPPPASASVTDASSRYAVGYYHCVT
jgi:hypothetical protein